tara:strand:- start:50938 stop:51567 length:630 start_codon:yes stop_codon:yes gene_type:complete
MPFENQQRLTRRRSSAGPTPPRRPIGNDVDPSRQGPRPTFLTLRDHGKVYVAELPNLSDGQLAHISKEVEEVLASLERRIQDLQQETGNGTNGFRDNDTLIKATTKHEVTQRFISAIQDEQAHRKNNPALKDAASESLPLTFLEVARHRLPGATFDSLLREALEACAQDEKSLEEDISEEKPASNNLPEKIIDLPSGSSGLPVVVSPQS